MIKKDIKNNKNNTIMKINNKFHNKENNTI